MASRELFLTWAFLSLALGLGLALSGADAHAQARRLNRNWAAQNRQAPGFRGQLTRLSDLQSNLSPTERFRSELKRSAARAQAFGDIVSGNLGNQLDYQSPMASVPGGYAMSVSIGSPARNFTGIADTGSDLVWVQCTPCSSSCFQQPDPLFDPTKSPTYKTLTCAASFCQDLPLTPCTGSNSSDTCTYRYRYGDASETNGDLALDTITLTTTSGATQAIGNFAFGCGFNNSGQFQNIDGLVGLGKGPLSFTSQLGPNFGNKFSYCLNPFGLQPISPQPAAPILFGDSAVPKGSVSYTPFVNNSRYPTFYYVNVQSISVNDQVVDIPAAAFAVNSTGQGGLIVDSGTTITYLAADAYHPLITAVTAAIPDKPTQSPQPEVFQLCYGGSSSGQSPKFPTITIHFQGGADYVLPPQNTFISVDIFGQTSCLAIAASSFPLSILGNVQQANYQMLFDRQNSRMGFASTQCGSV